MMIKTHLFNSYVISPLLLLIASIELIITGKVNEILYSILILFVTFASLLNCLDNSRFMIKNIKDKRNTTKFLYKNLAENIACYSVLFYNLAAFFLSDDIKYFFVPCLAVLYLLKIVYVFMLFPKNN